MTIEAVLARVPVGVRGVVFDNSTTSALLDTSTGSVATLYMPSTFAGTQLTIQVKRDETDWADLYYDGTIVSIPIVANTFTVMPVELFTATGVVRFVSDQTEDLTGYYYPVT